MAENQFVKSVAGLCLGISLGDTKLFLFDVSIILCNASDLKRIVCEIGLKLKCACRLNETIYIRIVFETMFLVLFIIRA